MTGSAVESGGEGSAVVGSDEGVGSAEEVGCDGDGVGVADS